MTKLEAITATKTFRKEADELLQHMKRFRKDLAGNGNQPAPALSHEAAMIQEGVVTHEAPDDISETIAQHILSIRDLESCIMRLGMALKYIGNPDPYPESRNPESPVVAPTADGLKL